MTTASDLFERTENPLASGWSSQSGLNPMKATGSIAEASIGVSDCASVWTTDSFGADQFSEAQLNVTGEVGVWIRGSSTVNQGYLYHASNVDFVILKYTGSWAQLGAVFGSGNVNNTTYRIEAAGTSTTTISVYETGSLVTTRTDSSSPITSGRPGIYGWDAGVGWQSWTGGDIAGPPVQSAEPVSDANDGQWLASSGADLFAMIDEATADDSDFIYTNTPGLCSLNMSLIEDPGVNTDHFINYRARGDDVRNLEVTLWQGSYSIGVFVNSAASDNFSTYVASLSTTQVSSITNYAALRLDFKFS